MKKFDCIVIGFGGVGSGALWEGAKRGWSMLGLDRFGPGHDRGSSHGQTRIIRRAYFEHPNYVPLVERSFQLWEELTQRHRTSPDVKALFLPTGLLQVGPATSPVIQGVQASASAFDLPIERFTAAEIEDRLPILKVPQDQVGIFESGAGLLRVELCVAAMIQQARKLGAEIVSDCPVTNWQVQDNGSIEVRCGETLFQADRLVIASGSWSAQLLAGLQLPLRVLRKQQHWFQLDRVENKLVNRFPAFLFEQEDGSVFYGMPEIDHLGMKVAEHSGGDLVDNPNVLNRDLNKQDLQRVETFLRDHFRYGYHRMVHFSQCMYTMSTDGHFIIDRYPGYSNVAFAAGLSGHGFKFAPRLGQYLVGLVNGEESSEFDFLKLRPFGPFV
jgi:monomeric sarcosine oxidase